MDEKKQVLSAVTDYIKTTGQLPEGPTFISLFRQFKKRKTIFVCDAKTSYSTNNW